MKNLCITICLLSLILLGCEDDPIINPDGFVEITADISGNWKIQQVTQNGVDITNALDFQSFALNLNYNGSNASTFSLASKSPFVTKSQEGSWSFDDPVYPTLIKFSDGTSAKLTESILSLGERNLNLEVVLGCGSTIYQYKLIK